MCSFLRAHITGAPNAHHHHHHHHHHHLERLGRYGALWLAILRASSVSSVWGTCEEEVEAEAEALVGRVRVRAVFGRWRISQRERERRG